MRVITVLCFETMNERKKRFKRKRHGEFVSVEVMCPECNTDRFIKWRKGVKRFKSRKYQCDYCGFLGRRGEWDSFDIDEWLENHD